MIDVNNPEINLNFIDQSTLIIFNKIDLIKNFSIENFLKKNNLKFDNSFIYALSLTSKINTDDFLIVNIHTNITKLKRKLVVQTVKELTRT
jgi:hypothetical protein